MPPCSALARLAEAVLSPTTVLGAIAVYIAWQQWQTNRQRADSERLDRQLQRKHDLFDRRWIAYQGVMTYIFEMTSDLKPETMRKALVELHHVRAGARFLFNEDVQGYLEELIRHGAAFQKWRQLSGQPPTQLSGHDHDNVVAEDQAELEWFADQLQGAPRRFEPYLTLSDD